MRIFVAHSSGYDFRNELYVPLRSSHLNKLHRFFLPRENRDDEIITIDYIKQSDVILAEVSYPSTGQGIELGWADISQVPILCIYKEKAKYSSSLVKLTRLFFSYADSFGMIRSIERGLAQIEDNRKQI